MERVLIKKTGLLSAFAVSTLLMTASLDSQASNTPAAPANGTQVAWWVGPWGGLHGGYHGYRPYGYYGGGYYNRGYYGSYYRGACQKYCWRNRYGNLRCNTRCYR